MTTLLQEIQAKCTSEQIQSRNHASIAATLNVGRVKTVPTEVGNGTILETLGITAGNALLDVINTAPDFRYVKPLAEQGRLRLDSVLVQATLQSLVGTVLTQPQVDALKAKCVVDDHVSVQQVAVALEG